MCAEFFYSFDLQGSKWLLMLLGQPIVLCTTYGIALLQNVEQPSRRNFHVWNSHVHQAAYGYSRPANFDGSVVHSMLLIYSPDGIKSTVQEVGSLRGYDRCRGFTVKLQNRVRIDLRSDLFIWAVGLYLIHSL